MRYLRSSRPAMAVPALVWTVLAGLFAWSWMRTGWSGTSAGAERVLACAQAFAALAAILAARRLRGRMRALDALHALLWLPPWLGELARGGLGLAWLGLAAAGSTALLAWAGGAARLRQAVGASARALAARADQRAVLLILFFALLWLLRFTLPEQPHTVALDPSWTRAYSWFFERGAQAGVDYVFTYGPLGALQVGAYAGGGLFWTKLAVWELAVKGALAAALALGLARLRGPLDALLFALFLLVLPYSVDAYVPLAAMTVTVLALSARRAWPAVPLALALLAALALVKFTYFAVAAACVAALAGAAAFRSSWRAGLGVLAAFALALASLWMLAGQSLVNFPRYLRGSLEIAAGFNSAMSRPASGERVVLACVVIALSAALAALHATARPREAGRAMAGALLPVLLFLAFKAGFVRHGGSSTFFGFAALAPFLLLSARERLGEGVHLGARARSGATTGLRLACAGVALLGFDAIRAHPRRAPFILGGEALARIEANLRDVLDLRERERAAALDLERRRRQFVLPRTRAAVGESTIDLISNEVGLLILNELNWQPRAVFQSYSAYTPALLELNARAFSGPGAPEFVLFRPGALDKRLATLDDALALQILLRRYRPELEEQGWLLLRRQADAAGFASTERPALIERDLALGEALDLGGLEARCLLIEVALRLSIEGRLVSALYQAPIVWIELGLADGDVRRQRLVPEMTRHGAILDPPLAKLDDWIDWYCGALLPRVAWIRLTAEPGQEALLAREARVRIVRADDLAPRLEPEAVLRLISSVLPSPPDEVVSSAPPERVALGRDRVLVVPAPGEVRYRLAPGPLALTCIYGVLPAAQEEPHSDGVTFRVLLRDAEGERALFEHHLDPQRDPQDRDSQDLHLRFDAGEESQLVLVSDPGPSGDQTGDRSYWARVRIFDPAQRRRSP